MTSFPTLTGITRINVVGCSGSGKSTVGKRIASILSLPYIETDELFWQPNWTEPPEDEFLDKVRRVVAEDHWVLDGNYSRTIPIKWPRTQMVVWTDLPYPQILWQVLTRTLRRSIKQEVLWAGNRESLTKAFLRKDSIIWWSITNMKRVRRGYSAAMQRDDLGHIQFVRLRSRKDVDAFIAHIEQQAKMEAPTS